MHRSATYDFVVLWSIPMHRSATCDVVVLWSIPMHRSAIVHLKYRVLCHSATESLGTSPHLSLPLPLPPPQPLSQTLTLTRTRTLAWYIRMVRAHDTLETDSGYQYKGSPHARYCVGKQPTCGEGWR